MKTKSCHFEIVVVLLLSVIPWPGPSVFKISCPRDRASMVRRIVQKRWIPILKKYQVELPLECPFHESRDIFYPQQAAKYQHRTSQWTCGLCGKSFYSEKHLEAHFDSRHKSNVNTAEDAVCLANYCDIMRCDVLGPSELESSLVDDPTGALNTDIQVWRENTDRTSTVVPCECRDLTRIYSKVSDKSEVMPSGSLHQSQKHCRREESTSSSAARTSDYHRDIAGPDNKSSACEHSDDEDDDPSNLVEAALPAGDRKERKRQSEIRRLKSHCKPEELAKLKIQCEVLVRDCIAGLLANLSVKDFQDIEGELNRAICWYLSCDRYWEDTKRHHRHTSWYLLITFLFLLSSGISACYYVVSVLLSSGEDDCMDMADDRSDDRPSTTSSLHDPGGSNRHDDRRKYEDGEDRLIPTGEMPDHYIYVAYPPELKRRLLESCYNRTTRL
ncbi:uncharacterized protein LOC107039492 isoform X1 [Diachasma alloeum]|uniref:uncharacterized protein LOC107039492 isoform X1 n=1 Tax=Diachasma alloeum TaxID=454923 RepID=UPI0007383ED0|nr:uncharacterized protein LOC107039492 isoform X1 [Diachasma alloeum]